MRITPDYHPSVIAYLLPVTYGIVASQDLMLRDQVPRLTPLLALFALGAVPLGATVWWLRRHLRLD